MANICSRRYLNALCTKRRGFNFQGNKAAYLKQHAEHGMAGVNNQRRSFFPDSCSKLPRYKFEGSKRGVYCEQYAEDGMVGVCDKRCLHYSCTAEPSFSFVRWEAGNTASNMLRME